MDFLSDEEIVSGKDPKYLTTSEERQSRLSKCDSCQEKQVVAGFGVCGKCNCIVGFKVFFKLSPCPLNKWDIPTQELPKAENA